MLADDCISNDCINRNNDRGTQCVCACVSVRELVRESGHVFVRETQWLLIQNGKAGC